MNLIFDKKTFKVISLFDNVINGDDDAILKRSFPNDFSNLGLWRIEKNITKNLSHLTIKMDDNNNPDILLYKSQEIYRRSEKEKEKEREKKLKDVRLMLAQLLPRTLRSSINFDIVKLWIGSNKTSPSIAKSLKTLDYFSDEKITPVMWSGPFMDAGGYANMNREIVFRLHNYHVITKVEIWPTAPQISPMGMAHISKYASFDFRRIKTYPKIHSFTPHPIGRHNGRLILFTMMETETLHPEFVRLCNKHTDEIWVPSRHNQKVFWEAGIRKDIYVMPLGIDETLYNINDSPNGIIGDTSGLTGIVGRPIADGINSFRFLTLFGWSFRKGTDVLIKSFVEEFTDDDNVALIICARHFGSPDPVHQNVIKSEVLRYVNGVRSRHHPQILLYPHVVPEQNMPSLYKMGHAFVHFSRGEGFSLPQIEASACGLPVVSCNNTGMSEYLTPDVAYLVETNEKEICNPEMHWISHFYHGQLFPKLGRDQIDQAKKHMRFVLNNYNLALKKNKSFKKLIFDKYTWSIATERVGKRIKEIG